MTAQQSTTKRDALRRLEKDVQEKWETEKVFEVNAPEPGSEEAR
jgi:leucyl-tRNA synthetase